MEEKKRIHFWIDAPLQLQMLATVLVLVTASLLLLRISMLKGLETASDASKQLLFSVDWARRAMRGPTILSFVISLLSTTFVTLIWSHRVAGPLRVLSAAIGRLRQGDFSVPLRVRESDVNQQLVRDFSHMQEHLRRSLENDRKRLESLGRKVREAAELLPPDHPAQKELHAVSHGLKSVGSEYVL